MICSIQGCRSKRADFVGYRPDNHGGSDTMFYMCERHQRSLLKVDRDVRDYGVDQGDMRDCLIRALLVSSQMLTRKSDLKMRKHFERLVKATEDGVTFADTALIGEKRKIVLPTISGYLQFEARGVIAYAYMLVPATREQPEDVQELELNKCPLSPLNAARCLVRCMCNEALGDLYDAQLDKEGV